MARVVVAILAAALAVPSAAGAISGEQRILLVLLTWGPEPYPAAEARTTLDAAGAFVRSASFGRTWIVGTTTPWLHALPRQPAACDLGPIDAAGRAAAIRAGFDPSRYTLLAYALPRFEACAWGGAYFPPGFWLDGTMSREVIAHELGHTYGVTEEGTAWVCDAGRCEALPYRNPYSVMGHGGSDYGAWEKSTFGWLDRVTLVTAAGELPLGAIDRPSTLPQALRVLTAGDEYWLEYRPPGPLWPYAELTPAGVAVTAGPHGLDDAASRYGARNVYVGTAVAGGTFAVPGAFAVSVAAAGAESARVAFRWTDRTPPAAPRIVAPAARVRGPVRVRWLAPRETGSGVAAYEVRLDGRAPRRVPAVRAFGPLLGAVDPELGLGRLARGRHRVTVVAVDRAGNRSRPSARAFAVG